MTTIKQASAAWQKVAAVDAEFLGDSALTLGATAAGGIAGPLANSGLAAFYGRGNDRAIAALDKLKNEYGHHPDAKRVLRMWQDQLALGELAAPTSKARQALLEKTIRQQLDDAVVNRKSAPSGEAVHRLLRQMKARSMNKMHNPRRIFLSSLMGSIPAGLLTAHASGLYDHDIMKAASSRRREEADDDESSFIGRYLATKAMHNHVATRVNPALGHTLGSLPYVHEMQLPAVLAGRRGLDSADDEDTDEAHYRMLMDRSDELRNSTYRGAIAKGMSRGFKASPYTGLVGALLGGAVGAHRGKTWGHAAAGALGGGLVGAAVPVAQGAMMGGIDRAILGNVSEETIDRAARLKSKRPYWTILPGGDIVGAARS